MVERHRNAQTVIWRKPQDFAGEESVVQQIVVAKRGPLRRTRRAAGELDVDRIVELQRIRNLGERVSLT